MEVESTLSIPTNGDAENPEPSPPEPKPASKFGASFAATFATPKTASPELARASPSTTAAAPIADDFEDLVDDAEESADVEALVTLTNQALAANDYRLENALDALLRLAPTQTENMGGCGPSPPPHKTYTL